MRIGDKVRLLRGTEEGYIVSIKGNIVEVEIEDGFTIPAVKNEIVVIDKKEAETFDIEMPEESRPQEKQIKQSSIAEGIYLGIEGDVESLDCYIINQTQHKILYSISIEEKKNAQAFAFGLCEPYDANEAGKTAINPQKGEIKFQIQAIIHEEKVKVRKPPIESNLQIQKNHLKEKVNVQTLGKAISLFNLEDTTPRMINAEEIKEQMFRVSSPTATSKDRSQNNKEHIIDLHVDPFKINLPENEVLGYQLTMFEKSFDAAIQANASQLKVIHGIGSGKLRTEIHKMLSRRTEVKYFEDGDKERFGFGSTLIYF